MGRVLLLNPPSPGRMTLRDFSCGESTKADYYWAPVDLLVLSGVLREHHDVTVLDAVVEELSTQEALRRAIAARPDCVFSLTAVVTLAEDDAFWGQLTAATGAPVYAMGDVGSFAPRDGITRTQHVAGFVQNFADPALNRLVDGDEAGVTSVVLRRGDDSETRPTIRLDPLRYPRPQHELFPLSRYRMPFTRWRGSTTVLTAYGCPFPCTFCNSRNLPYQLRLIDDAIEELAHVRELGLDEVYLRDFTFGPTRRRGHALCDAMIAADLGLRWSAECRIEVLDEALLDKMRASGCEVILVGVETGDAEVAKRLGKKLTKTRTQQILEHARSIGIRACGHFLLGSPNETREAMVRTIRIAQDLPLDYASFNLYAPRLGTEMRQDLIDAGHIAADDFGEQDVSAHANAFSAVDGAELQRLFRRAVLSFYFRPRQLGRLLGNTPWTTLARQGTGVVRLLMEDARH